MQTDFLVRYFLEHNDLEDREQTGRMTLRWILEKYIVKMGGTWK